MAAVQQQTHHQNHHHQPALHHNNSLQVLHGHSFGGMPHGLGLLTTVASLPPKYRARYLKIQTKTEIPLDLSVKPLSPQTNHTTSPQTTPNPESEVPMAVNFTEVYTDPCSDTQSQASEDIVEEICSSLANADSQVEDRQHNKPITPPLTPYHKRKFSESDLDTEVEFKENQQKLAKLENISSVQKQPLVEQTPAKQPIKTSDTAPKTSKNAASQPKSSRSHKATRKLKFDEETSSPVSGTIIRPLEDITDGSVQYSNGDIDPKYNIVEITEETKAELAAIKNVIGDYICRLCRIKFDDAFGLAQHRCACIVLLEYRCPECGKQFNCPANLASHRRWHKPRKPQAAGENLQDTNVAATTNREKKTATKKSENENAAEGNTSYECQECGKKFKRQAYLKKHEMTHQKRQNSPQTAVVTPVIQSLNPHDGSPQASPNREEVVYVTNSSNSSSSAVAVHHDEDHDEDDSMSGYSTTSSHHYGRLQIVETGLTEEENIAAAALTNLRNCASVIQHTTLAH
ncbi:zinc finger and SCAN domain-containing protein 30 [Musca domestica]|uniref:Zinc finger and SCAN domain-containing protein 30 n=1 Tax=Musca domestica TaxID=7370 RepID=A0A1I8N7I9_MUSDO|nr:zinc finger and SCAN domain-containing protein 30 [Musca domestica]